MSYENVPGRLYDIQGYAVHDGPGVRTTVYTKGCPLRCLWCHSPESQRYAFELGYLAVKCTGTELCGSACVHACPEGAIRAGPPVRAAGSPEPVRKIALDRDLCSACRRCAGVCVPQALYTSGWDTDVDEVVEAVRRDRVFFRKNGGVTISGGEPMSQFAFTFNLAKRLKESGLHLCLDTTGYAPEEQFAAILPYIDLFLYDIKAMDPVKHKKLTGVDNARILGNARFLAAHGAGLQIRVVVIPKLTDQEADLRRTAAFCASLGEAVQLVQLLPYHATGRAKYERLGRPYRLKNEAPPDEARMAELAELFRGYGLRCQVH